jgi:hypothetical protein
MGKRERWIWEWRGRVNADFLLLLLVLGSVSEHFTELPAWVVGWRREQPLICQSHPRGPRKNLPFPMENELQLLALIILDLGSGFDAPFIIVRQLLRK